MKKPLQLIRFIKTFGPFTHMIPDLDPCKVFTIPGCPWVGRVILQFPDLVWMRKKTNPALFFNLSYIFSGRHTAAEIPVSQLLKCADHFIQSENKIMISIFYVINFVADNKHGFTK